MPTPDQAFTEAWLSHRIEHGDDSASLATGLSITTSATATAQRQEDAAGGFLVNGVQGDDVTGGFLVEKGQHDSSDAGGFLPHLIEDYHQEEEAQPKKPRHHLKPALPEYLPLSEVPRALSILSLPADDEGILTVFKSAAVEDPNASSTLSGSRRKGLTVGSSKVISRRDFKQVCDVLLDNAAVSDGEEQAAGEGAPIRSSAKRCRLASPQAQQTSLPSSRARSSRLAAARQRRAVKEQLAELYSDSASPQDEEDEDEYRERDEEGRRGLRRRQTSDSNSTDSESRVSVREKDGRMAKGSRRRFVQSTKAAASLAQSTTGKSYGSGKAVEDARRRRHRQPKAADGESGEGEAEMRSRASLSDEQREIAHGAWRLFADKLEEICPGWDGRRIGKREIQRLTISVGEIISENEVSLIGVGCAVQLNVFLEFSVG